MIKKVKIPFCDQCGKPWLPDFLLADGTPNPLFEHPEDCKRCGKCKSTRWNAGGVDRRRKTVVESPAEIPVVTIDDVRATVCGLSENSSQALVKDLGRTAEYVERAAGYTRCKHGLYCCPECHPPEAQ
jgi:hypothetical protein